MGERRIYFGPDVTTKILVFNPLWQLSKKINWAILTGPPLSIIRNIQLLQPHLKGAGFCCYLWPLPEDHHSRCGSPGATLQTSRRWWPLSHTIVPRSRWGLSALAADESLSHGCRLSVKNKSAGYSSLPISYHMYIFL